MVTKEIVFSLSNHLHVSFKLVNLSKTFPLSFQKYIYSSCQGKSAPMTMNAVPSLTAEENTPPTLEKEGGLITSSTHDIPQPNVNLPTDWALFKAQDSSVCSNRMATPVVFIKQNQMPFDGRINHSALSLSDIDLCSREHGEVGQRSGK